MPISTRVPRLARTDVLALTVLVSWVALCAAQTLTFEYIHYDDPVYVLENPLVTNPSSVPFSHRLTTPEIGYPAPLVILTYRLDYLLVGLENGFLPHAENVLFHLGNVALVFYVARALGLATVAATFAAMLFGLHPSAAEPVAWITGRKDLFTVFFSLLAIAIALRDDRSPRGRALELSAFVLALASKPTAVALAPILVLVSMRTIEGADVRTRFLAAVRRRVPEIVAALLLIPLAYVTHRAYGGLRDDEAWVLSLRSAWYGFGLHLGLILGIEPACITHLPDAMPPPFHPRFDLLPLVVVAGVAGVARRLPREKRGTFLGALACALLAYAPSAGLVPMRRFAADSYVYPVLPGVTIAFAVAAFSAIEGRAIERLVRRLVLPATALLLGLLFVVSAGRFRSTRDVWAQAMELHPDRWQHCKDWAVSTREVAGPAEVLAATDYCIARFGPERFAKNRAIALYELGRTDEAVEWLRRAMPNDPDAQNVPRELLDRVR